MSVLEDGFFGESQGLSGVLAVQNENEPFGIQPPVGLGLPGKELTVNSPLLPVENGAVDLPDISLTELDVDENSPDSEVDLFTGVESETPEAGLTEIDIDQLFDPEYYLNSNADLGLAGLTTPEELYTHWQNYGKAEGRDVSVLVDLDYYAAENPDIGAAGLTSDDQLSEHLETYGLSEGRKFSPWVDLEFYLNEYPDLQAAFGDDTKQGFQHLQRYGMSEGRRFYPDVDLDFYLERYSDLSAVFGDDQKLAFAHWQKFGHQEGRYIWPQVVAAVEDLAADLVVELAVDLAADVAADGVVDGFVDVDGVVDGAADGAADEAADGAADGAADDLNEDATFVPYPDYADESAENLSPTARLLQTLSGLKEEPTPPLDLPENAGGKDSQENPAPEHLQFETSQEEYYQGGTVRLTNAWVFDASGASDVERVEFSLHKTGEQWEEIEDWTTFNISSEDDRWAYFDYSVVGLEPGKYQIEGYAYDREGGKSNAAVAQFSVSEENPLPLLGVIDTGFNANNPDIDYKRATLGRDWVDGDDNPLLADGSGSEHGTHVLGIIGATQNNGVGIYGMNDQAPLWLSRAIGSGQWADALMEFVDYAKESGQPNAVVNLSLDLTQTDAEGNVTTRYEFTPEERAAIEYARQHNVLLVVAAGNDGGVMSVLGQSSQEFDNIMTVGAAEQLDLDTSAGKVADRTDYSSYGQGLDVMAYGGTTENPQLSLAGEGTSGMAGTSVATAKVTGAVSQVWAANPELSYRQVVEIIRNTATDLGATGDDAETGAGLLNLTGAVNLAKVTTAQEHSTPAILSPETWSGEDVFTPGERAVQSVIVPPEQRRQYHGWLDASNPADTFSFQIDEPTSLQYSVNFPGNAVLRQNGRVTLEGEYDGNLTYAGADGKLSPGSYTLTIDRNGLPVESYKLIMNFLEGSQGQETPVIEFLPDKEVIEPQPTPTPPPIPQPTPQPTPLPSPEEIAAKKWATDEVSAVYEANRDRLGNSRREIQIFEQAFNGENMPAVQYFDGGYIVWNGQKAVPYFTGTGNALPNIDLPSTVKPIWDVITPKNIVNVPDGRHTYPNMRGSSEYWVELKGSKNDISLAARDTVLTHPDLRTTVYRDLGDGRLQQVPLTSINPDDNYTNYQDLPAGKYLVKVDVEQSKANIPYEMIVNLDQVGGSSTKAWNLNQKYGQIDGNRIIVSDHVGLPEGDKDLYAFTTSNFQPTLQFAVRSLYSDLNQETKKRLLDGDIKMRLLDANDKEVLSVDSDNREPTYAAKKLEPNSKYYLEVTAKKGSRTNYDLILNFEQLWAPPGRHEFEGLTGQLEYSFWVDSNAKDRTLHTAVRDASGKTIDSSHYTSKIYRQQNGQWVAVNPDSTGDSVFRYDSLDSGQYGVAMTPKSSMPSSSYTFVHNLDQAGHTRSDARNLGQIGGKRVTVNDHVGIADLGDYYKFSTGSDPRLLQFAVRHPSENGNSPLEGDVEFVLYDKNGKELKKVNSKNRKSIYDTYELDANTDYYVLVKAQSGNDGNYHLVLNAEVKRTVQPDPKPNPDIDIRLDFYGNFTSSQKNLIEQAAKNWENIITKDKVPGGVLQIAVTQGDQTMQGGSWGAWAETTWTDYPDQKNVRHDLTDGGWAGNYPGQIRMHFKSGQLPSLSSNQLIRLTMHELGHALGLDEAQYDSSLGMDGIMDSLGLDQKITSGVYNRLEWMGYSVNKNASVNWG